MPRGGPSTSNALRVALILVAVLLVAGCPKRGASLEGVYRNENSSIVLELKRGGQATLSIMGQTGDCTYTSSENQVTLDCKEGDKVVLTRQADGSLAGPPGSLVGVLKKAN